MQEGAGTTFSYGSHSYTDHHLDDLGDSRGLVEYPYSSAHPRYLRSRSTSLERGLDTKPTWIEYCKPSCHEEHGRLTRCEEALRSLKSADAERTCMYRYRQWFECMENCVQPKVFYHLKGANRRGPLDWFKGHGKALH